MRGKALRKYISQLIDFHKVKTIVIGQFQNQYRINGVALYKLNFITEDGETIDTDEIDCNIKNDIAEHYRKDIREGQEILGRDLIEFFGPSVKLLDEAGKVIDPEWWYDVEEDFSS